MLEFFDVYWLYGICVDVCVVNDDYGVYVVYLVDVCNEVVVRNGVCWVGVIEVKVC